MFIVWFQLPGFNFYESYGQVISKASSCFTRYWILLPFRASSLLNTFVVVVVFGCNTFVEYHFWFAVPPSSINVSHWKCDICYNKNSIQFRSKCQRCNFSRWMCLPQKSHLIDNVCLYFCIFTNNIFGIYSTGMQLWCVTCMIWKCLFRNKLHICDTSWHKYILTEKI